MDAEWIDRCLLRNPSRCESVGHPVLYELAYPDDTNAHRRSGDRCLSHLFQQVRGTHFTTLGSPTLALLLTLSVFHLA